jgi:uncharacterized protein (DUF1015 family)
MARVRPFAAWRYASPTVDVTALTAPPYDVISDEMRSQLLDGHPHNVVALELPEGSTDPASTDNRYVTGKSTWDSWRADGTLVRDEIPAIYVLEQRFELQGRPVRRRAFIAAVGLEPFDAGVVIPHERTLPKALGDRYELTCATGANLSQVFGLFEDPSRTSDAIFDAITAGEPVARATDADGVTSTLWACTEPTILASIEALMEPSRVFIADGHHRYTTALAYRDLRREAAARDGVTTQDPAYDSVLMALVSIDDPELTVLPYHRIADAPAEMDPIAFYAGLAENFDVLEPGTGHPAAALEALNRPGFLIKTRADDHARLVVLRDDVDLSARISADRSDAWKQLDVAVLQELILDPLLGIHPDRPETLDRLSFTKDAHEALAATADHDVAFILRPTRLDQLRDVSLGGEIMPQKSTYFYPKLLSGLLFRSAY